MKYSASLLLIGATLLISTTTMAHQICGAHTWHHVTASEGNWKANLQMITEIDHAWLVDKNCEKLNTFLLTPTAPVQYALGFDAHADFNMAYTLTLTQEDRKSFTSKTCVFVITANGPAQPDITIQSYHGAKCDWKVIPGVGEDFFVG